MAALDCHYVPLHGVTTRKTLMLEEWCQRLHLCNTGGPASMVVMTLPSKKAVQPDSSTRLIFFIVDRSVAKRE